MNETKTPSYLGKVRDELAKTIAKFTDDNEYRSEQIEAVWGVVRSAVVTSYWNGVDHGHSGKVKPKGSQPQERRGR